MKIYQLYIDIIDNTENIENIDNIDPPGLDFSHGEVRSQELQSDSSAPDPKHLRIV